MLLVAYSTFVWFLGFNVKDSVENENVYLGLWFTIEDEHDLCLN